MPDKKRLPRTHIQEEPLTSREQHRHSERSDTVSEALRERMQPDAACQQQQKYQHCGRSGVPPSGETHPGRRTYRVGFQVPFHVLPMFFQGFFPSQPGTENRQQGRNRPHQRKETASVCRRFLLFVGFFDKRFLRLNHNLGQSFVYRIQSSCVPS